MDKQKYYSIREDINIVNKITGFIDNLDKIMETYWQTKKMTLEEAKEFLWERYLKFEDKIQKELGVE